MQGMTFNMDGPVMEGTWYNPTTGDSFTVRDSFFEDNQYKVLTTDGRYMDYNQIQNYVKSDKPLPKQPKPKVDVGSLEALDNKMQGLDDLIVEEDKNILGNFKDVDVLNQPLKKTELTARPEIQTDPFTGEVIRQTKNYDIIDKALKNIKEPKIKIEVSWDSFPKREIELLLDIMEIPVEEIESYVFNKFASDKYKDIIKEALGKYFLNYQAAPEPEVKEKPKKTKKAIKK